MNTQIEIVQTTVTKDSEGFATQNDITLATVKAYREDRHGSERWANRSVFQEASSLFCFRIIPDLLVTPKMTIICKGERFRILSVENVRGRNMYVEALVEKLEPSMR